MAPWCLPSDDTFDHRFSGYSVWVEPDTTPSSRPALREAMEELAAACGGPPCGLHPFAPHVTLLYNIRMELRPTASQATDLLRQCLRRYQRTIGSTTATADGRRGTDSPPAAEPIALNATSYYYFPYPKSADGGRGFGCVISMLLLDQSAQLEALHEAAASVFPPDERHGEAGGSFRPHLALVYAPERCGPQLEQWTRTRESSERRRTISQSTLLGGHGNKDDCLLGHHAARCISLWKTDGTIDEWERISSLDLDCSWR